MPRPGRRRRSRLIIGGRRWGERRWPAFFSLPGQMKPAYDLFAPIYNRHWERFSIEPFPVLEELLLARLPGGAHILDVCCGTGQIARELVARGYRVTGVDSSAGMLAFARENAPGACFLLADARDFALPEPAEAAISTSDSLNHVTDPAGLRSVFRAVHRALCPGGLFVFDMNTAEKYRVRWTGSFHIVEDDQACLVSAAYDEDTALARFEATVFLPEDESGGSWRRHDVTIMERYHAEPEIRAALLDAGFGEIAFYDWQRDIDPRGEPDKFFVVCRRL